MRKLKLEELNRCSVEDFKSKQKFPVVVVLDNVRSALNVGSVFRTCDAFAIERLLLTGITARPPHKEINKTAIGATSSVEWQYFSSSIEIVEELKSKDYYLVGVEQTDGSVSLEKLNLSTKKVALIFGNEVDGISEELLAHLDLCLEIPQFGTKHSLNVAVCAGITIWDVVKSRLPK